MERSLAARGCYLSSLPSTLKEEILKSFPQDSLSFTEQCEDSVIHCNPKNLEALLSELKTKHHFDFLMQICGVDFPDRKKRFDVCYELFSGKTYQRVRVKVQVNENESVPTAQFLWKTADWFERETYEMYGISFSNHPNLRRLLTHHQFEGYPLRKDYPADQQQHCNSALELHFDEPRTPKETISDENKDLVPLNIGPAHPATHGTLRIMAQINGEKIHRSTVEIGYLHRCFEKMAETHPYNQVIPYTDRLNYCSAPINNVGYCKIVERLLGIEIPLKAQALRMILCELSRIIDHLICIGANALDLGALTSFFHLFTYREKVYTLFEQLCGARLTVSLTRIGGMAQNPPHDWIQNVLIFCKEMERGIDELETLLTHNKIWIQRTQGIGKIDAHSAVDWGYTGPCLRACGVNLDLRKATPYYLYSEMDFDIPVGTSGDVYDRYLVRVEEMRQSLKIIRQLAQNLPSGDYTVRDRDIVLPEKKDVYGNIEGLMSHFMLVMKGLRPRKGELYDATEGANGELGFYLVSDEGPKPYRLKVRPPCFAIYQSFSEQIQGVYVADVVSILGSMNVIAGELDR